MSTFLKRIIHYFSRKTIKDFKYCTLLTLSIFMFQTAQAQTPQWYWPSIGTSLSDNSIAMTSDSQGNTYVFARYLGDGEILGVKFNNQGTMLWATHHQGAAQANVRGALINSEGRLFFGMDSQTNISSQQQMAVIEINPATGAIIRATEYTHIGTSRNTHDLALQANGTDLMLVADDVVLKIDASDLSIQLQWELGVDPAHSLVPTDIKTALNEQDVTSTLTKSGFENTLANMPFFTGSPLPNTKAPTDATNYTFPAEASFTYGVTKTGVDRDEDLIEAISTGTRVWDSATAVAIRSAVETSEGLFVYFTMTLAGHDQQGIAKMSKTDIYTVEWSRYWRQSSNSGSILADENSNIYLYTWDQLYFFQSSNLDLLANKFDKTGANLWSKTYGSTVNEVVWRSGAIDIDQTNGRIIMNLYTDSYNGGTPAPLILTTNYDGVIQNYSILAPPGGSITPVAIALDGQGNAFIAGQSGAGPMSVAKVNTATLFNKPIVSSVSLAADNSYIDVTFSQGVYNTNGGSGALEASDFNLSITGGSATSLSVSSVTTTGGAALSGGETTI